MTMTITLIRIMVILIMINMSSSDDDGNDYYDNDTTKNLWWECNGPNVANLGKVTSQKQVKQVRASLLTIRATTISKDKTYQHHNDNIELNVNCVQHWVTVVVQAESIDDNTTSYETREIQRPKLPSLNDSYINYVPTSTFTVKAVRKANIAE